MADNYAKLWVQKNANQVAINRAQQAIQNLGRALPCRVVKVSGAIVTVAFEVNAAPFNLPQITIPKAESNWIRMPTQVGDFGMTMPADAYLGGVSGLGGGVATLTKPGNLSALVFVPVSNSGSPPIDQNAAQMQGPNGAIIRTTTGTTSEIVTNTNGTTITFGNSTAIVNATETALTYGTTSLVLNASGITMTFGTNTIVLDGSGLSINGESYENHTHGYFPGTGTKTQTDPPIN
ncbi:hypothetical protein [Paraburkholderia dilworthii]|uniref:hypothetical protein n=1 Tax=Paraburkholderia dilworthii TaxID=948106 RepID=UPI0003F91B24|nr:hypothetical protein [Paraburkholderia dilworthii]